MNKNTITGILIGFVLIILVFFFTRKSNIETLVNKTCILLTTTVYINADYKNEYNRPEDRLKIYKESIDEWLEKTKLIIYVVESSEYRFPEYSNNPRVKIYSFKSSNTIYCNSCSATPYEAESITKAFKYFKLFQYENIIKVTGKYFIPNIEIIIENIPDDSDIFLQNSYDNESKLQNSEIFGCKTKYLLTIMNMVTENSKKNMNIESTLYTLIDSKKYKIYRFPIIKLNKPIRRGDNSIIYDL